MKITDIRKESTEDLKLKVKEMKQDLFSKRFQQATGKIEKPSEISNMKKNIARILTVLRERKVVGK